MTSTETPAKFADAPRAKSHGGYLHTCNGDVKSGLPFGRKAPETCARCWELVNGAERRADYSAGRRRADQAAIYATERARHDCTERRCGRVCTAFDW